MANAGATTKQKQATTLSATIAGGVINSSNFKMTQVAAFRPYRAFSSRDPKSRLRHVGVQLVYTNHR